MTDMTQTHSGIGDNIAGDKIVYNFGKSKEFNDLEKEISEIDELLSELPEEKIELRYKYSEKRIKLKEQLEQFKREVLALAQTFERIDINTERLKKAKEYFDKGQIKEADAILNTEDLSTDLDHIINEEKLLKEKSEKIEESRMQLANEYLVKANLSSLQFDLPNRLEITGGYFEKSILAKEMFDNVFAYGMFLLYLRQNDKALELFEKCLSFPVEESKLANALNSIALVYHNNNVFPKAEENYRKALDIYERIAKDDPITMEPILAVILSNLALLTQNTNRVLAEQYYIRAEEIYEKCAKKDPKNFEPNLALILNNIGLLYQFSENLELAFKKYERALEICERIAKAEPAKYEFLLSKVLGNMGFLLHSGGDAAQAEKYYMSSIEIYERLVKENPQSYEPDLANVYNGLALLYQNEFILNHTDEYYIKSSEINKKVLEVYERLSRLNPQSYEILLGNTLMNFGTLQLANNETEIGMEKVNRGAAIARKYPELPISAEILKLEQTIVEHLENEEQ
jgi:Tfp pilus assembly protein PilF